MKEAPQKDIGWEIVVGERLRNSIKHLLILFAETAFCIAGAQRSRKFNKSLKALETVLGVLAFYIIKTGKDFPEQQKS